MLAGEAPSSSLTTKELQQNLKEVKRRERPPQLLFEVPSARVVHQDLSKHVVSLTDPACFLILVLDCPGLVLVSPCVQVYDVVLMRSGSFDSRRVSVGRRYSDFSRFHHELLEEFDEDLEEVLLPRKHLTRNFSPDLILERRLALQDYLAQLYGVRCVRHSPRFARFFTEPEKRAAYGLLRAGQFSAALQQLGSVLEVEEKLLPWQSPTLTVSTLAALAVCHRDLEEPEQAFAAAQRALPAARRYGLRYRAALLELLVDVGYQLRRPVAQLQEELGVLRAAERGEAAGRSLKELVVREFL